MEILNIKQHNILCPYCKTNFKYDYKDVETTWIGNVPFVRCPICNKRLFELKKINES